MRQAMFRVVNFYLSSRIVLILAGPLLRSDNKGRRDIRSALEFAEIDKLANKTLEMFIPSDITFAGEITVIAA